MYDHRSAYFTKPFADRVKTMISQLRPTFFREMDGAPELYFATRFNSDDQCWQAFVQALEGRGLDNDHKIKAWAIEIEHQHDLDRQLIKQGAWEALKSAASTDHYYAFEKQW